MADKPTVVVTDESFADRVLGSDVPVLVDFWATWCGPCRKVAPILEEIAAEHAGKIIIAKLDVDQNRKTSLEYRIMSIPTMLVFSEGKVVKQIVGFKSKQALLSDLVPFI